MRQLHPPLQHLLEPRGKREGHFHCGRGWSAPGGGGAGAGGDALVTKPEKTELITPPMTTIGTMFIMLPIIIVCI